ncbi:MAG: hypothetical protein HWN80_19125 [Candidatus Lokiarchaeota archaeon]|nr:hypothetical protein [Candidatus Lokiarchaeota archaeon]
MEEFRKDVLKNVSIPLNQIFQEFDEYFKMKNRIIYDEVSKNVLGIAKDEILSRFFLDDTKLKDVLYLPEILSLAEYMKENNFEYFTRNWNTYGYYHYEHGYKLKELIEELRPYANRIKEERFKKRKSIKESDLLIVEKINFIETDFGKYGLPEYDEFVKIINEVAIKSDFLRLLPILMRTLFENLLYYIFRDGLNAEYTDFYYRSSQYRPRNFSQLISLLKYLTRDKVFRKYSRETINEYTLNNLVEIKKIGNWTVHEILNQVDSDFPDKWREKTNRLVTILLALYKNVNGHKIDKLDDDVVNKIEFKFGISKNFNKLYKIFARKEIGINMSKELIILYEKIGESKLLDILKLTVRALDNVGYAFEGDLFRIYVIYKGSANKIYMENNSKKFDYEHPENNPDVKTEFLRYFREECQKNGIKVKG